MKLSTLFTFFAIACIFAACGSSYDEYYEEDYYAEDYYEDEADYYADYEDEAYAEPAAYQQYQDQIAPSAQFVSETRTNNGGGIVMHKFFDAKKGMVSGYMPLPADWKVTAHKIIGPNGTEIQNFPGGNFFDTQRRVTSIDQIIREDITRLIQQSGAQHLNTIDLPEIAANNQRMSAQYWKFTPTQEIHQVKGIEVKGNDGKLGLLVIHFMHSQSQYGGSSYYYMNAMSAPPAAYEKAKQHYLYGLANQKPDPQYVAVYNQQEQQKSQASWNAHRQRMASKQATFDSWNRTQQTMSEISDISMEGWRNRNSISDRMQERSVDGIWEREAVTDPYGGQQRKVQSGYNNYYMNQYGEYIGTNDEFYQPERDPNVNNQDWRRVQTQDNRY